MAWPVRRQLIRRVRRPRAPEPRSSCTGDGVRVRIGQSAEVRPDPAIGRTALVLPGGRSSSIRLGRQAVLAWLQVAPRKYDLDTTLLLVTELLARATSQSGAPFLLTVQESVVALRVEVREPTTDVSERLVPVDDKLLAEIGVELPLIGALADRWGSEWSAADSDCPTRVVWFECGPSRAPQRGARPGEPR